MKNLGQVINDKDIVTKEYADKVYSKATVIGAGDHLYIGSIGPLILSDFINQTFLTAELIDLMMSGTETITFFEDFYGGDYAKLFFLEKGSNYCKYFYICYEYAFTVEISHSADDTWTYSSIPGDDGDLSITKYRADQTYLKNTGGTLTGDLTVNKSLLFTDTSNPFIRMTTNGTNYFFQAFSGQFGLGASWEYATKFSSNGLVTFPITPKVGTTDVSLLGHTHTKSQISDFPQTSYLPIVVFSPTVINPTLSTTTITGMLDAVNYLYKSGNIFCQILSSESAGDDALGMLGMIEFAITSSTTSIILHAIPPILKPKTTNIMFKQATFTLTYDSTSDTFTNCVISSMQVGTPPIPVDNTTAYTPTGDYNPATKKYVDDAIINSSSSTTIITNSVEGSRTLDALNNYEYRYTYASGITGLTLSAITTPSASAEYMFTVVFQSGTTATTFTNTLGAYFTGDDCGNGAFTPVASKTYDLSVWWNGISWQGVVRGV